MNDLITISGVRGFIDEAGVAQLNTEDCARGLGFTRVAESGNEVVRWERVRAYFADLNFVPTSGYEEFIPENIFYRLAMKAKNETAEKFQALVADEILPTIRKTGSYVAKPLSRVEILEMALKAEKENVELTKQLTAAKPKVLFADSVSSSHTSILIGELAKILKQNGVEIGQNRLFEWLRGNGYLISRRGTDYNMPTQKSMELGLFTIKETTVNHSDGHITVSKTPKTTGKGQIYFVNKFLEENADVQAVN